MNIFITGSTSFLGQKIIPRLVDHFQTIYLCVNADQLDFVSSLFSEIKNIVLLPGDITQEEIFEDQSDRHTIIENASQFIHLESFYGLTSDPTENYMTSVIGLQNLLFLASQCKSLVFFHQLSSTSVAGNYIGDYPEDELVTTTKFNNSFSQTKRDAELLFRKYKLPNIKKRIYRTGYIVDEPSDSSFKSSDGPFSLLKALDNISKRKTVKFFPSILVPYNPGTTIPLVPANILIDWLTEMVILPHEKYDIRTYNLTGKNQPQIKHFLKSAIKALGHNFKLIPIKRNKIIAKLLKRLGLSAETVNYLNCQHSFIVNNKFEDYPNLDDFKYEDFSVTFFEDINKFTEGKK